MECAAVTKDVSITPDNNNDSSPEEQRKQVKRPLPEVNHADVKKGRRDTQASGSAASATAVQTSLKLCYAQTLTSQPVSKRLQLFVRRHIHKDASLKGLEAGGRGDCLFHSIGAALEQMLQGDPLAATHLRARCDVGMFQQSTQHVVQFLRNVTAESLLHWEDAALLNLLACYSLSERSGHWQDGWSPSRLLHTHNFGELVGCDAVRAMGPNPHPNADRDDIVVALTRSSAHAGAAASEEILLPISQGASYFAALQAALRE